MKRLREILAFTVLVLVGTSVGSGAVVETIDAREFEGTIVSLNEKRLTLETKEGKKDLPANELMTISLGRVSSPLSKPGQAIVYTHTRDILPARELRIEGNRLHCLVGPKGEKLSIPLQQTNALLLPAVNQTTADLQRQFQELLTEPGPHDMLMIERKNGTWQTIVGTLTGMTESEVLFTYRKQDRVVKRSRVRAIQMAKPTENILLPRGWVLASDGRAFSFQTIQFVDGIVTLQRDIGQPVSLPLHTLGRVEFVSDRLVSLSDLTPVTVRQHGLFDSTFPYRVNRSVSGSPLRLAGREYDSGLGLHSYCELTYTMDKQYRTFITTAGIDDVVRPQGNATLTLLGDGKELMSARLTGKDAPRHIRLDLQGVNELVLRVEFGPDDLDVSDHVDLVNARLVK